MRVGIGLTRLMWVAGCAIAMITLLGALAPVSISEAHAPNPAPPGQAGNYGCTLTETAVDPDRRSEAQPVPNMWEGKQYGGDQFIRTKDQSTYKTAMPHGDASKGMNQDGEITVSYAPPPSGLKPGQTFDLKITVSAVVRKTDNNAIFLSGWYEAQVLKVELIQKTGIAADDLKKSPTAGGAAGSAVGSASGIYRFTFPSDAKPTKLSIYEVSSARGGWGTVTEYRYTCGDGMGTGTQTSSSSQSSTGTQTTGEPVPPVKGPVSPPCTWTGTRENGAWGKVTLTQTGNQVTGTYQHYIGPIPGSGTLSGTVTGNTLNGQWTQSNGSGTFQFNLGSDCNITGGMWWYGSGGSNTGTTSSTGSTSSTGTNTGTATGKVFSPPGPGTGEPWGEAPGMAIQAGQRQVAVGGLVEVPVYLIKGSNVANINFDLTYNANIARPEGTIDKGNLLNAAMFSANASESGRIRIGYSYPSGVSGTGTLAYIRFRAVGKAGERTDLTPVVTTINNPIGMTPAIDRILGQIVIVGANDPSRPRGKCPDRADNNAPTSYDAYCALKMSTGLMPVDLIMDMDASNTVTSRDSTIILQAQLPR